jgi:hypothetical protein
MESQLSANAIVIVMSSIRTIELELKKLACCAVEHRQTRGLSSSLNLRIIRSGSVLKRTPSSKVGQTDLIRCSEN